MAYNPNTGTFDFGYTNPVTPTVPTSTTPGMDFGMGTTQQPTNSMGFGYQQPQMNITGTQQPFMNSLMQPQQQMNQNQGFFSDVSGSDWLNFGTNLVGLGTGIYYQNQALDQQQQSLDLARDKYNTYQQEQADLDKAYSNFG